MKASPPHSTGLEMLRSRLDGMSLFDGKVGAQLCLDALETFLVANDVDIAAIPCFPAIVAVRWGLSLQWANPDAFCEPFFAKFVNQFTKQGALNTSDFAELQSCALLHTRGVTAITPIPRTNEKTHDFDVVWGDCHLEVEVTRSQEKAVHAELHKQVSLLLEQCHDPTAQYDLIIHVTSKLDPSEITCLRDAAHTIRLGDSMSSQGQWQLEALPINRPPLALFMAGEPHSEPDWWPEDQVRRFAFKQYIATKTSMTAPPRVMIYFAAPLHGYISSASNKARDFQGSRTKPFILVLDANELPAPFGELGKRLDACFYRWKHISAVLVFTDTLHGSSVGWTHRLYINPHATWPLDARIVAEYTEIEHAAGGSPLFVGTT